MIHFIFIYLLTSRMLHYIVILHALELNIRNTVTYIYQLCTQFSDRGQFYEENEILGEENEIRLEHV